MTRVLLSPPDIGPLEHAAVERAMHSGWVAPAGPELDAFERELAARVGVAHAVAVSSGTAALHLALLAVGARPGTVVVTATLTFAATVNAIVYTGATPVLVDSRADGTIDPALLEAALDALAAEGQTVAAIVPVDLLGTTADYAAIEPLAADRGIPIVVDAAESLGATQAGRAAGAFGTVSIVSFNGNKIMTTSGGGMVLTDDASIAARCRHLSTQAREPVVHYEHRDVGFNYRMSNVLAALGRAQLARLDEMIDRRRAIRSRYRDAVAGTVARVLGDDDAADNCWLTAVLLPDAEQASALLAALTAADIEGRPIWKPMHLQPVFAQVRAFGGAVSEELFQTGVTLPSGSRLTDDEISRVVDILKTQLAR